MIDDALDALRDLEVNIDDYADDTLSLANDLSYLCNNVETISEKFRQVNNTIRPLIDDISALRDQVDEWLKERKRIVKEEEREGIPLTEDWHALMLRAEEIVIDLARTLFVM